MNILQAVGFVSLVSVATSSPAHKPFTIGEEVYTTSGIIRGHAAMNRNQVSEYLGIPFAKPPVNDLRFASPERYLSKAQFNASSFGTTCLTYTAPVNFSALTAEGYHLTPTAEQFTNINNENGLPLGEDCLTLNVWTKPQTGEKAKAVLFYIYGGGEQLLRSRLACLINSRFPGRLYRQYLYDRRHHHRRRRRGRYFCEVKSLPSAARVVHR